MGDILIALWVNSLWQGLLVTAIVAAGVRTCRRMNAATRERIWWCTLIAIVVLPLLPLTRSHALAPAIAAGMSSSAASSRDPLLTITLAPFAGQTLAVVWAVWIAVSLIRTGHAWMTLRHLDARSAAFPADREAGLVSWKDHRQRGRGARLVVSDDVGSAAVVGFRRPVIAISRSTLARLPDAAIDQIVIHEYAHIQRRDDIAVLLQRLVVALAGLNPAVWWLDRTIAIEREVACDDWVVAHTGSVARYATSLVELAAAPKPSTWSLAPGVAVSRSQLAIRVRRLLQRDRNASIARSRAALWLARPLVFLVGGAFAMVPLVGVTLGGSPIKPRILDVASATMAPAIVTRPERLATEYPASAARRDRPSAASRVEDADAAPSVKAVASSADAPPAFDDAERPVVKTAGMLESVSETIDSRPLALNAGDRGSVPAAKQEVQQSLVASTGFAWSRAADPAVAVGEGSRKAAVGTARLFSRFGKSIAGSF